jgi:SAM-dependent methyltransferase
MIKSIHPFPARMAPGLALDNLVSLKPNSVVLDPMSGSGTVLRQALELGHEAVGFDVDPLAVLMARVWTTPVDDNVVAEMYSRLLDIAGDNSIELSLPWMEDRETAAFVDYWFAPAQRRELTRLAVALSKLDNEALSPEQRAALSVLRLNLSRIIVTKEQAASLARDTSHSRPHRVALTSEYNVLQGYEKALKTIRHRLRDQAPKGSVAVEIGDARTLSAVEANTVDAVVTSPPYLNAIDYLRGHRMALVWLGWSIPSLRAIRSGSIGAERGPDQPNVGDDQQRVVAAMLNAGEVSPRHRRMIERYAGDLCGMVSEVARVLKPSARAIFVVGNSCLKGTFIRNADGVAAAAAAVGLREVERSERDLPESSRYLPVTGISLAKRMRTETVLSFAA